MPDEPHNSLPRLRRALRQQLTSLQQSGMTHLPRPRQSQSAAPQGVESEIVPVGAQPSGDRADATTASTRPVRDSSSPTGSRPEQLAVLRRQVAACTLCQELARTRTQTVFGVGDPEARLCFLGEAPGADEDREGVPFVGRAGQLLTKIIEACRLRREDVYILNILKCRPPGNRTPSAGEADNCRDFLLEQLAIIRPEFICCLGACAAQNLLQTTTPIGQLRGRFFEFQGSRVMATYHPAYLLRNPEAKRPVWDDMKMLMREMGTPID